MGWRRFQVLGVLLATCLVGGNGCQMARKTVALPTDMMTAVVPGMKSVPPDPTVVQAEVQRFADDFCGRTAAALDEYARRANTPSARNTALKWKLSATSSAISIATGPNPTANLLDFVALATLSRTFLEVRVKKAEPPGALDAWLEASRGLETNAWKIASRLLNPQQQEEFRAAITRWCAQNIDASASFFARPQDFALLIRSGAEKDGQSGGVFSMVGLDPMAGLDPAVREMARTRLFAERAMFTVQHMPFIVRWQVELLTDQFLTREQVTDALKTADRLSRAAESTSQTAAQLPDRLTAERKAILDALDAQEGKLRELSAQVGQTLASGEKMSTSLNTTLTTFDALMKRFGVGEPSTSPPDTNSPPFNILDYAKTADQVAAMAQQLDTLLKDVSGTVQTPALDKRIAELNALSTRAKSDAKSVLNYAFLLLAGLILLTFACALVYRRLGPRTTAPAPPPHRLAGTGI